jgi:hypothetical protein
LDTLWSVARYDLWLSEDEFLDLTPYALDLLIERHRAEKLDEWLRTGHQVATMANLWGDRKARPKGWSALDFVPKHLVPKEFRQNERRIKLRDLTSKERSAFFFNMFGCGIAPDGTVVRTPKGKVKKVKRG